GRRLEPRVHRLVPRRPGTRRGVRRGDGRARARARGADHVQVPRAAPAAQLRLVRGSGLMGLFTGLLMLPLAPVRGTVWIAEQIREEAERQLDPNERLRLELEARQ